MSILNNKRTSKTGVTLIEALFSVGIIAIVLTSVLLIFAQTVDTSKRVDYEYTATNLAKNRLERAGRLMVTHGFDFLDELAMTKIDGDFKRVTAVTQYPETNPDPRLKKIEVTVTYKYKDKWREDAAVVMTTVFTNVVPYL